MDTIFQSIEILSKEKGIDPQIVLDAVKDAMLIAARKHYRTNEDYIADMDPKTGAIKLYAVKKAVETVEDPVHEMTLSEALYLEAVLFSVACASEDKKEGTAAFLEKRAAAFKGK